MTTWTPFIVSLTVGEPRMQIVSGLGCFCGSVREVRSQALAFLHREPEGFDRAGFHGGIITLHIASPGNDDRYEPVKDKTSKSALLLTCGLRKPDVEPWTVAKSPGSGEGQAGQHFPAHLQALWGLQPARKSFSRLCVAQIICHSACTFPSPRSRNRRNPRASWICPNTGSTTVLRSLYRSPVLPLCAACAASAPPHGPQGAEAWSSGAATLRASAGPVAPAGRSPATALSICFKAMAGLVSKRISSGTPLCSPLRVLHPAFRQKEAPGQRQTGRRRRHQRHQALLARTATAFAPGGSSRSSRRRCSPAPGPARGKHPASCGSGGFADRVLPGRPQKHRKQT
jgi:hypothetical protein